MAPRSRARSTRPNRGALALLLFSAGCLFAAPALMPPGYAWVAQSISESAAQGVRGAWLARMGLLTLGAASVWIALARRRDWPRATVIAFVAFGALLAAAAAFSHRPWRAGAGFDPVEDWLHSFAANGVGIAYVFGLAACAVQHRVRFRRWRALDLIAFAASIVAPLALAAGAHWGGLAQRVMFALAYLWLAREALSAAPPRAGVPSSEGRRRGGDGGEGRWSTGSKR